MEFILVALILIFIITYRNSSGEGVYKFVKDQATVAYDQYAPYSYKVIREKIKELGLEYNARQYTIQVAIFAGAAAIIGYLLVLQIKSILPVILAIASSVMLYVIVLEIIPECQRSEKKDLMALLTIIGFSFMMLLEFILG